MRFRNGLSIGGRIVRYHVAKSICVPLLSMHRPDNLCWSWLVEWFRYRPESGARHSFFRITRHPGDQSFVYIDLFWLGCLEFVTQRDYGSRAAPGRAG